MGYAALVQRLAEIFPGLSPELRRAARYVLDRPDDVALLSMRGLARDATVHPSTMVRLARAAGFAGFNQFREPFRGRLREVHPGYLARARDLQTKSGAGAAPRLLGEVVRSIEGNLAKTFTDDVETAFAECARLLASSRRVLVFGVRSCFPVAYYFHYAYRMFRPDLTLLDGRGGTFADDLRDFASGDALVAISVEPYSAETVRAVRYAKRRGGRVVAITDTPLSPLAAGADQALLVRCEGPSFFGSIAAAMAVAEALTVLLLAHGGEEALHALAESEQHLQRFDAYWRQEGRRLTAGAGAGGNCP